MKIVCIDMSDVQVSQKAYGYSVNELLEEEFPKDKAPITILIPNYNYGKYIKKTIESVFSQGVDFFRVIIVDDNSTDDSREILKEISSEFKDLEVIFNKENLGINGILNRIVPLINSEFIVMLDADDWLANNFYDVLYNLIKKSISSNKKVAFAYSDCILVDKFGNKISNGKSCDFVAELIETKSFIPRPCILKTKALQDVLPLNESLANGAKHDMWKKIVKLGYIGIYSPKPLFYYRMHQRNISGIGKRILSEIPKTTYSEAILSGYWRAI